MNQDDLTALLESYGVTGIIRRNSNLMAPCPFHDERRPSWGISLTEPHLHGCFACHARGSLLSFVMQKSSMSFSDAADALKKYGYEADPNEEGGSYMFSFDQPMNEILSGSAEAIEETFIFPYSLSPLAKRYMTEQRGVTSKTLEKLEIVSDTKQKRVLFPWYLGDQFYGATGRLYVDREGEGKTIPYFDMKKGCLLYLPARTLPRGTNRLILVEGEIDAIKVYQAGFKNVAALGFGTFTDLQKNLSIKLGINELVCFFDNNKSGRYLTKIVAKKFEKAGVVRAVDYRKTLTARAENADPASISAGAVCALINSAPVYFSDDLTGF
jgi:DNA primase